MFLVAKKSLSGEILGQAFFKMVKKEIKALKV